jgi:hypothetical protein
MSVILSQRARGLNLHCDYGSLGVDPRGITA